MARAMDAEEEEKQRRRAAKKRRKLEARKNNSVCYDVIDYGAVRELEALFQILIY